MPLNKNINKKIEVEIEMTVREKIKETIKSYSHNRRRLTDVEIADLRVSLSIAYQALIEEELDPGVIKLIEAEITLDRIEALKFEECRKKFMDLGSSASQSIDLARKNLKAEEGYIDAKRNYEYARKDVGILKELIRIGQHILNSMSFRKT